MGAQNTKERAPTAGTHSIRTARNRPRPTKDGRQTTVSNIFTEHNGMNHVIRFTYYMRFSSESVNVSKEYYIERFSCSQLFSATVTN